MGGAVLMSLLEIQGQIAERAQHGSLRGSKLPGFEVCVLS